MPFSTVSATGVVLIPSSPPPTPPELRYSSSVGVPSKYFSAGKNVDKGPGDEKKVNDSFGIRDTDEESGEDLPSPTGLLRGRGAKDHVQRQEDVESARAPSPRPTTLAFNRIHEIDDTIHKSPKRGSYQDLKKSVEPGAAKVLAGRLSRSGKKSTYFCDGSDSKIVEKSRAQQVVLPANPLDTLETLENPQVLSKHPKIETNIITGEDKTKPEKKKKRKSKSKENHVGEEGQRKIKRAKITKPGVGKEAGETEVTEIKKGKRKGKEAGEDRLPTTDRYDPDALGLEKVLLRRDKWTPTKQVATVDILELDRDGIHKSVLPSPTSTEQSVQVPFDKIIEAFGLPTPSSFASTSKVVTASAGPGRSIKRRKMDVSSSEP